MPTLRRQLGSGSPSETVANNAAVTLTFGFETTSGSGVVVAHTTYLLVIARISAGPFDFQYQWSGDGEISYFDSGSLLQLWPGADYQAVLPVHGEYGKLIFTNRSGTDADLHYHVSTR